MTSEQAAKQLDELAAYWKRNDCRNAKDIAACRLGAAALRQGLPKRWPLKWEKVRADMWRAPLPCGHGYAVVTVTLSGRWRLEIYGRYHTTCSTARSARRASERAVARAIAESMTNPKEASK